MFSTEAADTDTIVADITRLPGVVAAGDIYLRGAIPHALAAIPAFTERRRGRR
jgi:hypothetical protein